MPHFTEFLRSLSFWSLDFLKGRPVKRHYDEIKFIIENPTDSRAIEIKKSHLDSLLEHATSTTKYYSKFKGVKNLTDFPILTKPEIVRNFEDFESTIHKNEKRFLATTSGSTGFPLKLWLDKNKKNRNTADTIYFSELANYVIGRNLVYLKLWVKKNNKNRLTLFQQNILKHDVMDYTDDELDHLLKEMSKNRSPKIIIGYSSFLEYLCNYMSSSNKSMANANVKSIIAIAEALSDRGQKCLKKHFNTGVYRRYSNQENGILAQQTVNSPDLYISNSASYVIEFLHPEKDEPAQIGSWGRIVITDLFNYAMPIIRYDTGDLAIAADYSNGNYKFSEVLGRKFDMIYNTKGELVIPHTFLNIEDYSDCKQFQFIQVGEKEYKFKINGDYGKTDEKATWEYFKDLLGEDATLNFEYVEEIPILSSGKHQKVISTYKKPNP